MTDDDFHSTFFIRDTSCQRHLDGHCQVKSLLVLRVTSLLKQITRVEMRHTIPAKSAYPILLKPTSDIKCGVKLCVLEANDDYDWPVCIRRGRGRGRSRAGSGLSLPARADLKDGFQADDDSLSCNPYSRVSASSGAEGLST